MSAASAGLARITINAPRRRIDVALPDSVPLAELLPELLRHAGAGLADDGERHGGWLLRRSDGTTLSAAAHLAEQDIRDGTVLHLVPALTSWPELQVDDMLETVADGVRRQGAHWHPAATRATALTAGGVLLATGLVAVIRADLAPVAAAMAVALVLAGVIASRAYGDASVGAVLAAFGLPFAAAFGWLEAPEPAENADRAMLAAVALLLAALPAAAGVAHLLRLFVAATTAALLGAAGGLLATTVVRPTAAAAIVLAALVGGVAAIPLLAIRLGKLPMPMVTMPDDSSAWPDDPRDRPSDSRAWPGDPRGRARDSGAWPGEPRGWPDDRRDWPGETRARSGDARTWPGEMRYGDRSAPSRRFAGAQERRRILAAVARTDEMLIGMLLGFAIVAGCASWVLARSGDISGLVLVAVAAAAMLFRARSFVTVRHRLPLIGAGLAGFALLGSFGLGGGRLLAVAALAVALIVMTSGVRAALRRPSPYLEPVADVLDTLCVIAVIPLACAVAGLYGLFA